MLFCTYPQHVSELKQRDALLQSSFCAQASVPLTRETVNASDRMSGAGQAGVQQRPGLE